MKAPNFDRFLVWIKYLLQFPVAWILVRERSKLIELDTFVVAGHKSRLRSANELKPLCGCVWSTSRQIFLCRCNFVSKVWKSLETLQVAMRPALSSIRLVTNHSYRT